MPSSLVKVFGKYPNISWKIPGNLPNNSLENLSIQTENVNVLI